MVNDTPRIRNATSAARSSGSRGSPRTQPLDPPLPPFGILILMATVSTSSPDSIQTIKYAKRFDKYPDPVHRVRAGYDDTATRHQSNEKGGFASPRSIVPLAPQTKRDPQYMRVF